MCVVVVVVVYARDFSSLFVYVSQQKSLVFIQSCGSHPRLLTLSLLPFGCLDRL